MIAITTAGAQVTMRSMLARDARRVGRQYAWRERVLSMAMLLLLTGVGVGNLTHLDAPVTTSTLLITLGVLVAALGTSNIYLAGKEEADAVARSRPTSRGR